MVHHAHNVKGFDVLVAHCTHWSGKIGVVPLVLAPLGSLGGAHFATIGRQDLIFKLCICTEDMMNRIAKHQPHHHHHHHHHYHRHHHQSSIIIITAAGRLGAILPGSRQLGMAAAHQGRHSMRASCSQHPFLIPHFLISSYS